MVNWDQLTTAVAFLSPILGWLAERRYRQMPQLRLNSGLHGVDAEIGDNKPRTPVLPSLSIIVPARNEAVNLRRLLPSLCRLDYPGRLEVIVVDDNSSDETRTIAREYGLRVLTLDGLPEGWLGKPHACHQGSAVASGEWLLFTDADTVHAPMGPAQAVSHALNNQLDGLTCHLQHNTKGWLDSLTLTTAYAGLFAGLSTEQPAMNGQYILLRRDVYARSGGFAAVRHEMMDDLALGFHLHDLKYHVPMLRGEDVAEVAMYQSSAQLWRGMLRISAGSLRWSGSGSLVTMLLITALMTPLLAVRLVLARRLSPHWIWLTWGSAVAGLWPWSKRFGPQRHVILAPFGALFVQAAAVWGLLSRLAGRGIIWKGRSV